MTQDFKKRFDKIGFNNQAIIVGFKRVELKDFIRDEIQKAREEVIEDIRMFIEMGSHTLLKYKETGSNESLLVSSKDLLNILDTLTK